MLTHVTCNGMAGSDVQALLHADANHLCYDSQRVTAGFSARGCDSVLVLQVLLEGSATG